jgi:hypothetical protein
MAHIIYRDPNLSEFCFYQVEKLKDKTFALNGYYIMPNGVKRITFNQPIQFNHEEWERESGWTPSRESSSIAQIYEFKDPATQRPTMAKITSYNNKQDHFVELTDNEGRREYILTTDNDLIIILVGIAAATCIGALILSRSHGKCQDVCRDSGGVKELHIGVTWKLKFIPVCESKCICKQ